MHCESLKLLHKLFEESNSDHTQKFKPEMLIEYLEPLCGTEAMLVLELSMLVLESCPTQTIELFLSGKIPADLVNSYLKHNAPNMQVAYLELTIAMNESNISGNLQNDMQNGMRKIILLRGRNPCLLWTVFLGITQRFC